MFNTTKVINILENSNKNHTFATMNREKRNILSIFLLLLFAYSFASNNLFLHTHIIGDVKVSHSHPYSNSCHGHSSSELNLIDEFNNSSLSFTGELCVALVFLTLICSIYTIYSDRKDFQKTIFSVSRAPPVCFIK